MALSASQVWEVRSATGANTNGGAFNSAATGTDYSQQGSAQVTYSDLVIGATNTQLTSAAHPFTAAHVGNVLNITAGSGFTAGRYEVVSVAGSTATMDRAVGTAASTGGVGNLGGALADPSPAFAAAVTNNIIWATGSWSPTGNAFAIPVGVVFLGYGSARGDGTRFAINATGMTAGQNTLTLGAVAVVGNVAVSNSKGNAFTGGGGSIAYNCTVTTATGSGFATFSSVYGSSATGCGNFAFYSCGCYGCYAYANSSYGFYPNGNALTRCIARACSPGFVLSSTSYLVSECVAYGNTGDGFYFGQATPLVSCVSYGNSGYGYKFNSTSPADHAGTLNCYAGSNTSGATNFGVALLDGTITNLSAQPFVDPITIFDFSPNATAGGGALLRAGGYPGLIPGLAVSGFADAGAIQHQDSGGAAAVGSYFEG